MLLKAWRLLATSVTIFVIACGLAYGIIVIATPKGGPVVEVIKGPKAERRIIPARGLLSYELTTRRIESCPGTLTRSWQRRSNGEEWGSRYDASTPVLSTDIRSASTSIITIQLPPVITPGVWLYTATVDSQCPLRRQQDITAQFEIEVLPEAEESP